MSDLTQAARDAEALRAKAIVEADGATLAALLGEDLVHIHTLGTRDDRNSYLAGISERLEFKAIERHDLVCRQYGDVVVMTGLLANTLRRQGDSDWVTVEAIATQVWDCSGGTCRLVSFHATRTPHPPAGDPPR